MLDELIEKAKKKRKLVSIYRSEDTERFMTGYILACSDEFLLLSEIDCYGNYDGFMVLKRDALYRCEIESTHAKRAQKLYSLRGQQHPTIKVQDEEEIISSIFRFAQETQKVVSIELRESDNYDVTGIVTALDDNAVFIHQLTDDGSPDGDSVVLLEDVTEVCCDSQDEQAVKILSEHQDK